MVTRLLLGILMILALLFMADQEFTDGRYTRITGKAIVKVRNSIGI